MRGLDCFVLPSLAEGISNTILEAMASGLPVVATDVGGNAELVVDGQTGELVPSGDVRGHGRQCIAGLAGDPARAAAMGAAGRLRVERHFSLPAMVDAYQCSSTIACWPNDTRIPDWTEAHVRHHRHLRHARHPAGRSAPCCSA